MAEFIHTERPGRGLPFTLTPNWEYVDGRHVLDLRIEPVDARPGMGGEHVAQQTLRLHEWDVRTLRAALRSGPGGGAQYILIPKNPDMTPGQIQEYVERLHKLSEESEDTFLTIVSELDDVDVHRLDVPVSLNECLDALDGIRRVSPQWASVLDILKRAGRIE